MNTIESVLHWPTSETGIKYRMIEHNGIIIRGLVKTEGTTYRIIFEAYKNGNLLVSEANSYNTEINETQIYENLKEVYDRLDISKPSFNQFLAMSL